VTSLRPDVCSSNENKTSGEALSKGRLPICKTGKGHCRRFTFDVTQAPRQLRFNDDQLADFEEVKFSQVNPE